MDDKQEKIYTKILAKLVQGENLFITGAAGVGKSYFINGFMAFCREKRMRIAPTSSTGISSIHIGGETIHRYCGFGIQTNKSYVNKMKNSHNWLKLVDRIRGTDIIILDEISMIRSDQFELINKILQEVERNDQPFGGKKMIFVGDFLQMPPVVKKDEFLVRPWAFQTKAWKEGEIQTIELTKVKRQLDTDFVKVLHKVRIGVRDDDVITLLRNCEKNKSNEKAIRFVATNILADEINFGELSRIDKPDVTYFAEVSGVHKSFINRLIDDVIAPERLVLREGARVILLKNDPDNMYTNGSMGTIIRFEGVKPLVQLDTGSMVILDKATWEKKDMDDKVLASFKQYPLKLAYAITIHKSQGMTLDSAEIDCRGIFSPGQLYVALSRVRSAENLILRGFQPMHIMVDENALQFYDKRKKNE